MLILYVRLNTLSWPAYSTARDNQKNSATTEIAVVTLFKVIQGSWC